MAWVKLDDQFFRNPKIIAAGRDARDLYMASLCYAASALTDGVIPANALRMLGAEADIDDPKGAAERLVECDLWERHDKGFRVHDFHDYNPSAEKVLAERAAAQERMRRVRSGEVQPNNERTSPNPVPVPRPVPIPSPVPSGPSVDGRRAKAKTVKTPVPDDLADLIPPQVWTDIGAEQGLSDEQLHFETGLMVDHCRKKAERYADWVAAWRSWMRSAYRQSKPQNGHAPPNGNGPGYRPKFNAQGQRVYTLADLRAEERDDHEPDSDAVVEVASRLASD